MTTPATSGPPSHESFAWFDPESCSWKTSQLSLLPTQGGSSGTSSVTWPKQGTTQSGRAYERPTLVLPTRGNESSLLPTPVAQPDGKSPEAHLAMKARMGRTEPTSLEVVAKLLPTPQAHDCHGGKTPAQVEAMRQRTGAGVSNLNEVVNLLPTPSTEDRGHDAPNRTGGGSLTAVVALLPTPTSQDAAGSRGHRLDGTAYSDQSGTTLTDAALLAGASTPPPSLDGNPSSESSPPTLWTREDG